jgi:hypothetical protein
MTDVFKQGFFEVQDANSQLVLLDVKPGMRIVDTCAGRQENIAHCRFDGKQRTIDCHGFIRKVN